MDMLGCNLHMGQHGQTEIEWLGYTLVYNLGISWVPGEMFHSQGIQGYPSLKTCLNQICQAAKNSALCHLAFAASDQPTPNPFLLHKEFHICILARLGLSTILARRWKTCGMQNISKYCNILQNCLMKFDHICLSLFLTPAYTSIATVASSSNNMQPKQHPKGHAKIIRDPTWSNCIQHMRTQLGTTGRSRHLFIFFLHRFFRWSWISLSTTSCLNHMDCIAYINWWEKMGKGILVDLSCSWPCASKDWGVSFLSHPIKECFNMFCHQDLWHSHVQNKLQNECFIL